MHAVPDALVCQRSSSLRGGLFHRLTKVVDRQAMAAAVRQAEQPRCGRFRKFHHGDEVTCPVPGADAKALPVFA
jgi:hypothetical protein